MYIDKDRKRIRPCSFFYKKIYQIFIKIDETVVFFYQIIYTLKYIYIYDFLPLLMNNMSSSSSSSGDKFFDDFLEDITRCLTKDESKQQQIRDNMKAKFMAEDSVRIYNQSQDQLYCHPSSESHPDSWRISSPADCENKDCVHHYCSSSSSSSSTSSSLSTSGKRKDSEGKRSSEATLKLAAINRSFFTVAQPEIICPANCSMNGNCIKAVNMLDVRSEIVWFWGELNATTTQSTSERRRKIIN